VNCTGGHITQLVFAGGTSGDHSIGIGLIGTIPAEIAELSQLQEANLHTGHLSATIPTELGQMMQLARLWLHGNDLTGTAPSEIGDLKALAVLVINTTTLLPGLLPGLPFEQHTHGPADIPPCTTPLSRGRIT
jgi:hypothetical protein